MKFILWLFDPGSILILCIRGFRNVESVFLQVTKADSSVPNFCAFIIWSELNIMIVPMNKSCKGKETFDLVHLLATTSHEGYKDIQQKVEEGRFHH